MLAAAALRRTARALVSADRAFTPVAGLVAIALADPEIEAHIA